MNDINVKTNFENIPFIGTLLDEHAAFNERPYEREQLPIFRKDWAHRVTLDGYDAFEYEDTMFGIRVRYWLDAEKNEWVVETRKPDLHVPFVKDNLHRPMRLSLIGEDGWSTTQATVQNMSTPEHVSEDDCIKKARTAVRYAMDSIMARIMNGVQLSDQTLLQFGTTTLESLEDVIASNYEGSLFAQMVRTKRRIERLRRTIIGERNHTNASDLELLDGIDKRLRCYLLHADMENVTQAARRGVAEVVSRIGDAVALDITPDEILTLALEEALIPLSYGGHQG